jgi:hypothetical protein
MDDISCSAEDLPSSLSLRYNPTYLPSKGKDHSSGANLWRRIGDMLEKLYISREIEFYIRVQEESLKV